MSNASLSHSIGVATATLLTWPEWLRPAGAVTQGYLLSVPVPVHGADVLTDIEIRDDWQMVCLLDRGQVFDRLQKSNADLDWLLETYGVEYCSEAEQFYAHPQRGASRERRVWDFYQFLREACLYLEGYEDGGVVAERTMQGRMEAHERTILLQAETIQRLERLVERVA